jgi:hypothetical protein
MSNPMQLSPDFSVGLRDQLAQCQPSVPTLACRSRIPSTVIVSWLLGESCPSPEQAHDLADALGITVSVLHRAIVDHSIGRDHDDPNGNG